MIEATIDARVPEFLGEVIAKTGIPGISVAMYGRDFCRSFAAGVAVADAEEKLATQQRFQLGCITKLLTGILVLRFAEAGKLDLDAPVDEYLPELQLQTQGTALFVRHVASHASGRAALNLADPEASYFYSWDKFVQYFCATPHTFTPGTVFNYDHADHVILGRILQRVSGRSFEELCSEYFLEPAGVRCGEIAASGNASTLNVPDHALDQVGRAYKRIRSVPYCPFWECSLSRLTLSPIELINVVANTLVEGNTKGKQSPIVEQLTKCAVALPSMHGGRRQERLPLWFGLGCAAYAEKSFGHNGSARGQTSGFRFDPDHGNAVVVSLNAWQPYARDLVLSALLGMMRPEASRAESRSVNTVLSSDIEEWCGRYVGGVSGSEIVVQSAASKLTVAIQSKFAGSRLILEIGIRNSEEDVLPPDAQHQSVGFFRDPVDRAHALMFGLNAFKRVS